MIVLLALFAASPTEPVCDKSGIQSHVNACALDEFHRANRALNKQWAITMAAARKADAEETVAKHIEYLRKAQRAWLVYREAHCDSVYPYMMGAQLAYTMNVYCQAALTDARTAELAQMVESIRVGT